MGSPTGGAPPDATPDVAWIDLDGAVNVRDLGGLPTTDGRRIRSGRLIRADNLQDLSERDVDALLGDHNVRAVVDLRTGVEVRAEGPGPLTDVDDVEIRHLSLFPESGERTDAAQDDGAPVVLPWHDREAAVTRDDGYRGTSGVYLGYLEQRADSVLAALRLIASSPGATVVHCAAGKDRTGVVIALALSEVGVTRAAVVSDYARSAERIEGIFARLRSSTTYEADLGDADPDRHAPRPQTMERLLDALDETFGGVSGWLRAHGWTDDDAQRLRSRLLH